MKLQEAWKKRCELHKEALNITNYAWEHYRKIMAPWENCRHGEYYAGTTERYYSVILAEDIVEEARYSARKLQSKGDTIWCNAISDNLGNVNIRWHCVNVDDPHYDCTIVDTNETFKFE